MFSLGDMRHPRGHGGAVHVRSRTATLYRHEKIELLGGPSWLAIRNGTWPVKSRPHTPSPLPLALPILRPLLTSNLGLFGLEPTSRPVRPFYGVLTGQLSHKTRLTPA